MSKQFIKKISGRSKKYSQNFLTIKSVTDSKPEGLTVEEAVKLILSLDKPNFKEGPSAELHASLNIDSTKSDQLVRSSAILPHGTGKTIRVAAFVTPDKEKEAKDAGADIIGGEELVEKIKQDQKINFDKAVAVPEMMKKLPSIARILGVAGVMPNPKTGTVGENIAEIIKTIKAGKIDYKNDKTGNVHLVFGKINSKFDEQKLIQNLNTAIESIQKSKPEVIKKKFIKSLSISTSNSPSIKIKL
jgi:large subunit ribosomal protein L1